MGSKTPCKEDICKYCGRPLEVIKLAISFGRRKERIVHPTCPCVIEKQKQDEQNRKRQAMLQLLRQRGFESGRYARMTFKDLSWSHMGSDVIEAVKGYMRSIKPEQPNWLYLYGDCGVGKTHLAVALAREIALDRQWKPALISWAHYLGRVQQSWHDARVKVDGCLVRDSRVLVLDDIDKNAGARWMLSHLYDIIDYRYIRQLPIIMTANRSMAELCRFWDESQGGSDLSRAIVSRIMGQLAKIVRLTAEDFRLAG
jgi:DNA replication protein DnaC